MQSVNTDHHLSISKQCDLLSIPRSSYYYQGSDIDAGDDRLMRLIETIWLCRPHYGYRSIRTVLHDDYGLKVNHKRVQRLMGLMKLKAIYPTPKTSERNTEHNIYPYLLRDVDITHRNQVWQVDITYIKVKRGFAYMVALIDVYSRFIVGYEVSIAQNTECCLAALERALMHGVPEIINSDQGSQFTSHEWTARLKGRGIRISMDGKGRAIDNIYIERFWRSLKYEEIHMNPPETVEDVRKMVARYVRFYNYKRPHQSLGNKPPARTYFADQEKCPVDMMDKYATLRSQTYPHTHRPNNNKKELLDMDYEDLIYGDYMS